MKNIIHQKPTDKLFGRTRFATEFVFLKDIIQKECLDIGCGYGWMELFFLKHKVKKSIGLELHEEDLVTAKKYVVDPKVKFVVGSAIGIPLPNSSIDTIVSWDVIEHIPKGTEQKMFEEMRRVLKKNGICYLSTPYRSFIGTLCDPAWILTGHRHYKKSDMVRFAQNGKFHIEGIIIKGGWWELLWLFNLYITKWIFHRRPLAEAFFMKKQDEEYKNRIHGFMTLFVRMRKI